MDRNSKGWLGTWGREEVGTQGKERPACTEKDTGEGWGEWVSPRLRLTASDSLEVQANPI